MKRYVLLLTIIAIIIAIIVIGYFIYWLINKKKLSYIKKDSPHSTPHSTPKQNQKSHATSYNRYPEIFKEIKRIIPSPSQILSFGCSTGIECETLQELYFPNIKIIGLDINEKVITNNIKKNKYKNIEYYSKLDDITKKSDIIFANSVLCRWPESGGQYTFETFENTLGIIDNLLNKDGYLCIYNSKYLFCETNLFLNKKYEKVETSHKETGFVTKYHKNNEKINNNYPFYLFKKTAF